MAENPSKLSIIIPLHESDNATELLKQIEEQGHEILIERGESRAKAMNQGAAKSTRKFLLFLHADSVLSDNALTQLQESLEQKHESLHSFTLRFSENDSMKILRLNALGAKLRTIPFGDQGLCLRKDLFFKIGGFPEDAPIGEDHLFVWHALRHRLKLTRLTAPIYTSPRKYIQNGWLKTTLRHNAIFLTQAAPQLWKLMRRT